MLFPHNLNEFWLYRGQACAVTAVSYGPVCCVIITCKGLAFMANVSPAQFVRQVRQEISRISWANRRDTGLATLTVFIMATIAAIFFLLVDFVLSNVVQLVLGLGA